MKKKKKAALMLAVMGMNGIPLAADASLAENNLNINKADTAGATDAQLGGGTVVSYPDGGMYGVAIGYEAEAHNTGAKGDFHANGGSIAIGEFSQALDGPSIAIGNVSKFGDDNSHGFAVTKASNSSIAIGSSTHATGNYSMALGYEADAADENSIAIGRNAKVSDGVSHYYGGIAMGFNATSHGGIAIGDNVSVEDDEENSGGVAIGELAHASGGDSIAIGADNYNQEGRWGGTRAENNSIAFGGGAFAKGTSDKAYAMAIGQASSADHDEAMALGHLSAAQSQGAVALGSRASVTGENSVAIGSNTEVTEDNVVGVGGRKITQVAEGIADTDGVNVSQLKKALAEVNNTVTNKVADKADTDLGNLSDGGKTVIEEIAKNVDTITKVKSSNKNIKVTEEVEGNIHTYDVSLADDVDLNSVSVNGKTYITNIGINANGEKITNVANGDVSENSTDAVNGGQLYEVRNTIINSFDTKLDNKANTDLDNITENGEKVILDLAKTVDTTAEVKAGDDNIVVSSEQEGNKSIYMVRLGDVIRANSFGVGDKVYISESGLNANSQRIVNVAAGVNETDAVNVGQLHEAIENVKDPLIVKYDSEKKDTVTLQGAEGTTINNVKDGKLSADSKEAVNGSQLHETNQRVEKNSQDIKNIQNGITQNNTDIKNLQQADKLSVKYTDESKTKIVLAGEGGTVIKNVKAATEDDEAVNFKQLNDAIENVIAGTNDKNAVHYTDDTHQIVMFDGEGGAVLAGVSDGKVEKDSKEGINGGQLYKEQEARKKADKELSDRVGYLNKNDTYHYISIGNNVAQNLEALDKAVDQATLVKDNGKTITIAKDSTTKVIDVSGANGETRVIEGVKVDPSSPTSAANVGYVNEQVNKSQTYTDAVGAQAAAMANLHPLEYSQNDKVSVAAAVGSYKNQQALALGAFYRPDRKTLIGLSGSLGRNDNMIGIGLSKRFGKTSEIEEMTEDELRDKVSELNTDNGNLRKQVSSMEDQMAAMAFENAKMSAAYQDLLSKVDFLMAKMGGEGVPA